jgi:2-polyprenyl-3-methyl-5-hydroxy-6-metoxy-1,4-benzoquinol methylase
MILHKFYNSKVFSVGSIPFTHCINDKEVTIIIKNVINNFLIIDKILEKYNEIQIKIIENFKMKSQAKPLYDYRIDNIYNDHFLNINLKNKNILELGPSQCHFLRLMKKNNANVYGIDMDESVKTLAHTFDIFNIDINNYCKSVYFTYDGFFDIIFCKNSINIISINEDFLLNIDKITKKEHFIFIIPWINNMNLDDCTDIFKLLQKFDYKIIKLNTTDYTYMYKDSNTTYFNGCIIYRKTY